MSPKEREQKVAELIIKACNIARESEREAIRKLVADTAASSGPMDAGNDAWRAACECIDQLIQARGKP